MWQVFVRIEWRAVGNSKSNFTPWIDAAVAAARETIGARLRELDAIVGDREPLATSRAARRGRALVIDSRLAISDQPLHERVEGAR